MYREKKQYKCIYCLLDWRKHYSHCHIRPTTWRGSSTTWQQFRRGPDVRQTDRRRRSGRRRPPLQSCHTSRGMGSSLAACNQTAGPATACEDHFASWCPSGSGLGPWCSWGPSAAFRTWRVFCPGPTVGRLYASDRRLCSDPASSSSPWHWQPSYVSWQFRISPASWTPVPRTRIQSRCSSADETSWWLWDGDANARVSPQVGYKSQKRCSRFSL